MTNEQWRQRARELAEHDAELRASWPAEESLAQLRNAPSCIEALADACQTYADRPCLHGLKDLTFADLWVHIESIAAGLSSERLVAATDRVGICGFGSVDWALVDLACLYLGAVSVPLPTGGVTTDVAGMINDAGVSCLACSATELATVVPLLPRCPTLRTLIVTDAAAAPDWPRHVETLHTTIAVRTLDDLEDRGRRADGRTAWDVSARDANRLRTLVYTSGSGGRPKGAMFPERVWLEYWRDPARGGLPPVPGIRLASLPLGHIAGRRQLLYSLVTGGVTHFMSAGVMSTLLEDVRRVRPTVMMLVPRVSGLIYQHFQTERLRRPGAEREIVAEMRDSFLGDRLLLLITGSAPTPPEVTTFLADCFQVPVLRGYATTEAGVLTFDERTVSNVLSFRLQDAAALGYLTTDTPYPRGELLVTTRSMVPGYHDDPEATRDLFTADGFMRTHDIVEQRGPNELVWIGRVEDVVKLAQGEFVEISRLESIYAAGSPFIRQIYIHANSLGSSLAAAIVPDMTTASTHETDRASEEASIRSLLADELHRIARDARLRPHELPRDCLVIMEPFTVENGLLTESGKLARHRLKAALGQRLDPMCELTGGTATVPAPEAATDIVVKELIRPFLASTWRSRELPGDIALGPRGLALDSMGLLEILLACEAHFGVALAVEDLRSDKNEEPTLSHLVELVASRRSSIARS